MSEIIIDPAQQLVIRSSVSYLLSNVGLDSKAATHFDDFLLANDHDYVPVDREIKYASVALGRLYFCSMNGKQSERLTYVPGEQMMLSLISGRTVREDPKPIINASIDFAESHSQSDLVARQCVEFAFTGIVKLRERSEERPKLFIEAKEAVQKSNDRFNLF